VEFCFDRSTTNLKSFWSLKKGGSAREENAKERKTNIEGWGKGGASIFGQFEIPGSGARRGGKGRRGHLQCRGGKHRDPMASGRGGNENTKKAVIICQKRKVPEYDLVRLVRPETACGRLL